MELRLYAGEMPLSAVKRCTILQGSPCNILPRFPSHRRPRSVRGPLPTAHEYRHPGDLFSRFTGQVQTIPLDDTSLALLRLRYTHDARDGRQLQDGRMLAFAQPGEQHDLPAR